MNFKELESAEKLRGGFYTPEFLGRFLCEWVGEISPTRVLEPSCGDGSFLRTYSATPHKKLKQIVGFELNPEEAAKAKNEAAKPFGTKAKIYSKDFLNAFVLHHNGLGPFDAVLGNPPFIRYQYMESEQQFLAQKIFERFNLPFTKHTNAWVPFVIASLALLAPGGRLAMVIPSEIFHIPHANSLRTFLREQCAKTLICDSKSLFFEDALQGTVLLLAEKKKEKSDVRGKVGVVTLTTEEISSQKASKFFEEAEFVSNLNSSSGKWMNLFLTSGERSILEEAKSSAAFARFGEIASADVGIVTGANKFFLVPDSTVEKFELQEWSHPMFGRSDHVNGVIYGKRDHNANRTRGVATNFLWFDVENESALPSLAREYIQTGEAEKLHTRYKCRIRKPWFKVPSVYTAEVGLLKRAHSLPRLIRNKCEAFTTDTAYRIRSTKVKPNDLVASFVNSVTALSAELEGRHYGGGVLELVPSEIERLYVPNVTDSNGHLKQLDNDFRSSIEVPEILERQDEWLLGAAGFTKKDRETALSAWERLKKRRQRAD